MTDDPRRASASPDPSRPDPARLVTFHDTGSVLYASVVAPTITTIETPVIGAALSQAIKDAPDGLEVVVLDLERVTMVNSTALGMFVTTYSTATNRNIRLILSGVTDTVIDILTVTRLNSLLTVCRTAAELERALRTK